MLTLLDRLDFERNLDSVTDQDSAGLQGDVPVESEVLAVDLGRGGGTDDVLAVRRDAETVQFHIEDDRFGHPMQGKVAVDVILIIPAGLDRSGMEGDRRILFDVQEIGGTEVAIALIGS